MAPKTKSMALLLWFASMCGVLGFHRFYLRRYGTGVLWFMTGGLFVIGAIVDLFRLGRMVDEANGALERESLLRASRGVAVGVLRRAP